jgi:nicotinate dehydrogenase subunit B
MAAVVTNLAELPDSDIQAMAAYLVSFNANAPSATEQKALAERLQGESRATARPAASQGARLYAGACAVCHEPGGPVLLGVKPPLALNSNVHSASPDNLIRVILEGIDGPLTARLGAMPAFGKSLDDRQVAELVAYVRSQFAPGKPAWGGVEASVARVRASGGG